jgi:hypothetical protein
MSEIERLSSEQLAHLEELLRERGAPVVPRLQPPATPGALASVEEHLGRALPLEVKRWWEWHDGTDIKPDERAVRGSIGPSFIFLRTEWAIEDSQWRRSEAEEIAPEDPDSLWSTSWLAIGSLGKVACDCAVGVDAPAPILKVDPHLVDEMGAVAARSFGEMVRWWIEALEAGAWIYEPEHDRWERKPELIPLERDLTRLI